MLIFMSAKKRFANGNAMKEKNLRNQKYVR